MGARLGIKTKGYSPYNGLSWDETAAVMETGTYPTKARLSQEEWDIIQDYVLRLAPDSLTLPPPPLAQPLQQFLPHAVNTDQQGGSLVTYLRFQADSQRMIVGNGAGQILHWQANQEAGHWRQFGSPILEVSDPIQGKTWVTEAGQMNPTERASGSISVIAGGSTDRMERGLHRPVQTLWQDLDGDGLIEAVVAEYGNRRGGLYLLVSQANGSYEKRELLGVPGAIRIIPTDLNGDQKTDLLVLAAQGNESIWALTQQEDLQFSARQLLRFSPLAGSSWMELKDYDGDGDLDLILVQGDNADYSILLKPYHGLRIFLNDGNWNFSEAFFYPLHGATRVIAEDFDQDGDLDFAITAFFPDFARTPEAGFVYLENEDAAAFSFQPHTFPTAKLGHWLVMEAADMDQDGDQDLLLGSFTYSLSPLPATLKQSWQTEGPDLIWLENVAASPQ
jgi:hypothetical protein